MANALQRVLALSVGLVTLHQLCHLLLLSFLASQHNIEPVDAQMNFGCSDAYCSAYGKCPEDFSCRGKNKILLRNVTTCGCCHRCIVEKAEGEECPVEITGNLPGNQCGQHLKCERGGKFGHCSKITSKCETERAELEASASQSVMSIAKPDCDQFGEYIPKRCKNGTICHCVNELGDPIFGLSPYNEAKEMNCLCARQFELVNQKLREVGSKAIEPINFMRCLENGNYASYQVHLHYSYCVHPANGTMWDRPVIRTAEKDLPCVNSKYKFKTDCIDKYNRAIANITKLEQQGYQVVGFDLPRCALDGSFHPVQCLNNKCFCVDQTGKPMRGKGNKRMEVDRGDTFAQEQECTCARHMEKIRAIKPRYRNKVTELFGRYQCDINGNYLPVQCSDSACYCVDSKTGYAAVSDNPNDISNALKSEPESIKKLFCYIKYTRNNDANKIRLNEFLHISNS